MSFAKNMGKSIGKNISKNLSSKCSQKTLDHAKQSATDPLKTSDLIGNKIAGKITRVSKTSPKNNSETNEEVIREKYISQELRQKIIDDLRLKEEN